MAKAHGAALRLLGWHGDPSSFESAHPDLARPNMVPTRLDNVTENLIWAADGSEVDTVVAAGRLAKHDGEVLPFLDGTLPGDVLAQVQKLSELFVAYRAGAPEVRGTGAHG